MFSAIRPKAIAANTAPVSINCRSVTRTTRNGNDSDRIIPPRPNAAMMRPA